MLRKIICALLFCLEILFSNNIKAQQNLVPNPSFEDTLLISGQNFYLEHHITNWNGGRGYFNANQVGSFGSVPSNDVGYQYPRTGNAYCGIYTYAKYTSPIRQYIQTKLKQKLVYNKKYKVSFYVSLGDTMHAFCNIIGAYFTADSSDIFVGGVLNQIPQIQNGLYNDLNDKNNWTLVSDTFVANGNESWITICNFYNDSISNPVALDSVCSMPNGWGCGAYYYIDDVSVELVDETGLSPSLLGRDGVGLFPNPNNGLFQLSCSSNEKITCQLLSIAGQIIESREYKPIHNSVAFDYGNVGNGLYLLRVISNTEIITLKVIKE